MQFVITHLLCVIGESISPSIRARLGNQSDCCYVLEGRSAAENSNSRPSKQVSMIRICKSLSKGASSAGFR